MHVLYVDDEPGLLDIARIFLEQTGQFSIDTVQSAPAALDILATGTFDAIISDFQMPGMDGIELLKRVRSSDKTIPFILFTGRGREEVVIDAINNGADFYIQKGGEPQAQFAELAHKVRQAVLMRRSQLAVAEQEERYHDLQNASDLIQSIAPDGRFLFVNQKWLDTLGYKKEDLPGLTVFDIIHGDSLEHCRQVFGRVTSGENVGMIEAVFRTRDGIKVYVQGMATCKMADGKPLYTRGVFTDVTFRKWAEIELVQKNEELLAAVRDLTATGEELQHNYALLAKKDQEQKESEEMFRAIFANSPYPIAITSLPENKFLEVNRAFLDISGYTAEEVLGTDPVSLGLIPLTEAARLIAHRLRTGMIENVPLALTGKDGRRLHVLFSTMPVTIKNRPAMVTVTAEVTKLKRVEEELLRRNEDLNAANEELSAAGEELRQQYDELSNKEEVLRKSEEKFRALVEFSLEGILITDFLGKILFLNRAAGRMVDVEQYEAVIGRRNVMEFIAPDSQPDVLRDFTNVAHGTDTYLASYRLITAAKREVWVESIGRRIPFGETTAVLISLRDVTDRKRAGEALRQANKKLTMLSGITRHDIKNQLLVLDSFIALLRKKVPDPSCDQYFSRIAATSQLIASLILFTKEYEMVGVHAPGWQDVRMLVDAAGHDTVNEHFTLKNDLPAGTEIFADPLIARVFFNLLDNARRHGGKVTTVRFSIEDRDGARIIVCADDGDGVPDRDKERIFERGFGRNTGFGLAITREILDITGITIRETGKAGNGARFEIAVPKSQIRSPS